MSFNNYFKVVYILSTHHNFLHEFLSFFAVVCSSFYFAIILVVCTKVISGLAKTFYTNNKWFFSERESKD